MTSLRRRVKRAAKILFRDEDSAARRARAEADAHFLRIAGWFQEAGRTIEERGIFVGCPLEYFEVTSRDLIFVALMEGLRADSSVLEVGCGCLRSGYWFIRFLEPGRYCGIEPNQPMLDAGRSLILQGLEAEKQPRFSDTDHFDFGGFGTTFDFVVAFSVWSHASKAQIGRMLDAFVQTANPGARFITSWLPAAPGEGEYQGDSWVGRSHQSDEPGLVRHSEAWIREAATSRGLRMTLFEDFRTMHQQWLVLTRP